MNRNALQLRRDPRRSPASVQVLRSRRRRKHKRRRTMTRRSYAPNSSASVANARRRRSVATRSGGKKRNGYGGKRCWLTTRCLSSSPVLRPPSL